MRSLSTSKPRRFSKKFIHKFLDDGTTDLAAQLAYYFFLSLFPLLLFLLTLLPYFPVDVEGIITFIRQHAPEDTGKLITDQVR